MAENYKSKAVEEYIESFPYEVQKLLLGIRELILSKVADSEELISYGIPSYKYKGKNLIHFAGFKKHIGLYPTPAGVKAFEADIANYKTGKGSIQFPLNKEIPWQLIEKIIEFRLTEMSK